MPHVMRREAEIDYFREKLSADGGKLITAKVWQMEQLDLAELKRIAAAG